MVIIHPNLKHNKFRIMGIHSMYNRGCLGDSRDNYFSETESQEAAPKGETNAVNQHNIFPKNF